ncbi:MAG: sensor histidine kinase [Pyrinomonadaceae bacterium]
MSSAVTTDPENSPTRAAVEMDAVLRTVLETKREAAVVVCREMRIEAANAAAAAAFARRDQSIEGRRLSEVVRDPELHSAFQTALNEGRESDIRLELIGGPTERRKFDVHVAPLELGGRRLAVGFFYDVTKVEDLETVRQEFLSNISHELRTPLTSILAFVETLEDGAIDDAENGRRFLGVIRRNAERMKSLISDILELSMIESGNVSVSIRDVRVKPIADDVIASLSSAAGARSVELVSRISEDAAVHADSTRLEQMLTNLIDNAIKFNREGGSVTVDAERRGQMLVISVADTGEGITPAHLGRVFERFYRTDRARNRSDAGGTGLGLAIVKHLAKLQAGEVSVESELARGTTFFIELPAA